MEPETGLTISIIISVVAILARILGKPAAKYFSKFMETSTGKLSEQQEIRDDRQKNIEWLRTQLIDEENNNKKEIHAYKEEINNLVKQMRELTFTISTAESNLIISDAEKKVLSISNRELENKVEKLMKENIELHKKLEEFKAK